MSARLGIAPLLLIAALGIALVAPAAAMAAGTIEGEVVDAVTKVGIDEVEVCAYPGEICTESGPGGEYAISGLSDDDYVVEFWAPYLGYLTQFYDGASSFGGATEVTITGGSTATGVDAEMEQGGRIEGHVTDAATNAGIGQAEVCAFSESAFGCTESDGSGAYSLIAVPTDAYVVGFAASGYPVRYYNEKTTFGSADLVAVTAPDAATGIDARLSKPAPPITTPTPSPFVPVHVLPGNPNHKKPKLHCKKGFKKVKRHGRARCVKRHRKKHHRRH